MAEPFLATAALTVALDIKNPECYLALGPTRALARELDLDVDWLPLVTSPPRPAPAGDDRGARHKRRRVAYRAMDLARYAQVQGLIIRELDRTPDSTLAGMAMLAARSHSDAALHGFLDRAFERYWNVELDLEDHGAIRAILAEVGVAEFDPDSNPGREAFAALGASLGAAGLFNAPAYLVEDEVFQGRAHLPMIRWILTGRTGPGPI